MSRKNSIWVRVLRWPAFLPAVALFGLALVALGFDAFAVVDEWHDVVKDAGSGGAIADAGLRLAIGIVFAALQVSPALVAVRRRDSPDWRGSRGYAAASLITAAVALVVYAWWYVFTTDSSTAALAFLYPMVLCPLLAIGVASSLRVRRPRSE